MTPDTAQAIALKATAFIFAEEPLRDRFLALTGIDADEIRNRISDRDFLASLLEFLMGHDPDLISFASAADIKPETIKMAWRALGGGEGHEW